MADRLYRSKDDRILGGVCGGLAEYFDLDPTLVRLGVILLEFLTAGSAIVFYLIAWLIIPSETEVKNRETSGTEKNSSETDEAERNELDYESPDSEETEEKEEDENSSEEKEDQK